MIVTLDNIHEIAKDPFPSREEIQVLAVLAEEALLARAIRQTKAETGIAPVDLLRRYADLSTLNG